MTYLSFPNDSLISNCLYNFEKNEIDIQSALEKIPIMLNALDSSNNIQIWNKECEKVTGYKAEEIVGKPDSFFIFLYPDKNYRSSLMDSWEKCNFEFSNCETSITCKDGTKKGVVWSSIPEKNKMTGLNRWFFGTEVVKSDQFFHQMQKWETSDISSLHKKHSQSFLIEKQLFEHRKHLEIINHKLLEANKILSAMIEQAEKKRVLVEQKFDRAVNEHILPMLETLYREAEKQKNKDKCQDIIVYIKNMCSMFSNKEIILLSLSCTESKIAKMITNGFSSNEIAEQLFISLDTVKTHRKNIRKKLNIKNKRINLTIYLRSMVKKSEFMQTATG